MKKILSTTLVAIAFAMVSTVDAKQLTKGKTTTTRTMTQAGNAGKKHNVLTTKRTTTGTKEVKSVETKRTSNPEVKKLNDNISAAIQNPTEENKQAVIDSIPAKTMTDDEKELAVLKFQKEDTLNRIDYRKSELRSLSGWFDFIRLSAEEKAEKAKKAEKINNIIKNLEKDLASIEKNIASLKPQVSESWYNTISTVAKGLGVLGLLTVAVYGINKYTEGGVKAFAEPYYEAGKGYASQAGEKMTTMYRNYTTTGKKPTSALNKPEQKSGGVNVQEYYKQLQAKKRANK